MPDQENRRVFFLNTCLKAYLNKYLFKVFTVNKLSLLFNIFIKTKTLSLLC